MRKPLITLLCLFVLTTGAGCGSDDDSDEAAAGGDAIIAASSLSRDEFVERAEGICTSENEAIPEALSRYLAKHGKEARKDEAKVMADAVRAVVVPVVSSEVDQIRKLGAPEGDEEEVEAFLVEMEAAVEALKERRRVDLASDLSSIFRKQGRLGRAYGLDGCAYD